MCCTCHVAPSTRCGGLIMTDVVIHVLHGHEVLPLWAGVGRHFARGVCGSRRTGLRLSLCACLLAGWRTGDGTGREPLVPPDHLDLPPPLLGRPGLTRAAGAACMMPACRGRLHQLRPVPACYLCAGGPQQLQHHVSSPAPASADAEVPAPWLPPGSQPPEGQGGESDGPCLGGSWKITGRPVVEHVSSRCPQWWSGCVVVLQGLPPSKDLATALRQLADQVSRSTAPLHARSSVSSFVSKEGLV